MGYDDNTPLKGVTGGGLPADIWREVMVRVHEGLQPQPLKKIVPEPRMPPQTTADVRTDPVPQDTGDWQAQRPNDTGDWQAAPPVRRARASRSCATCSASSAAAGGTEVPPCPAPAALPGGGPCLADEGRGRGAALRIARAGVTHSSLN